MTITDLEEFREITPQDVREYLERKGFQRNGSIWLHAPSVTRFTDAMIEDLGFIVRMISNIEGRSVQAVLREMNPRMRRGCPSVEARIAHSGRWLAQKDGEQRAYVITFDTDRQTDPGFEVYCDPYRDEWNPGCSYHVTDFRNALAAWSFWPVDASNSKLPWPRDAEGKEL